MNTYDPDATRRRILEAADAEFARHGPAGARIDRIAETARVNKQAIYHHFGAKDVLLARVLSEKLDALAASIPFSNRSIEAYVGELFDFHVGNPDLVRLVLWEGLSIDERIVEEDSRRGHYAEKIELVRQAQARGEIDPSLEPRFVILAILSLISWQLGAVHVTRMLHEVDEDPDGAENLAARRAFVIEAVRRICSPGPAA